MRIVPVVAVLAGLTSTQALAAPTACSLIPAAEMSSILGRPVAASADDRGSQTKCTYETVGGDIGAAYAEGAAELGRRHRGHGRSWPRETAAREGHGRARRSRGPGNLRRPDDPHPTRQRPDHPRDLRRASQCLYRKAHIRIAQRATAKTGCSVVPGAARVDISIMQATRSADTGLCGAIAEP